MACFGGQLNAAMGAVSSVVEHRLYTPAVTGSNPVPPTTIDWSRDWKIGELAECTIANPHSRIVIAALGS